jgi:hypothetical protein
MTYLVRWIVYKHQVDTIESEWTDAPDLNKLVETCEKRLDEVRMRHADRMPNGYQILSEDGDILRQIVDQTKPV